MTIPKTVGLPLADAPTGIGDVTPSAIKRNGLFRNFREDLKKIAIHVKCVKILVATYPQIPPQAIAILSGDPYLKSAIKFENKTHL